MWRKTRTQWLWESSAGRLGLEKQRPSNVESGRGEVDWHELADTQKRSFQNGPNGAEGQQRVAVKVSDEERFDTIKKRDALVCQRRTRP
jgi:hypothetical protein